MAIDYIKTYGKIHIFKKALRKYKGIKKPTIGSPIVGQKENI